MDNRQKIAVAIATAIVAMGVGGGMAAANAGDRMTPRDAFLHRPTPAGSTPELSDGPDVPGQPDLPEPGDTPDAPG